MGKISKSTLNKVLLRTQGCQFAHNYERMQSLSLTYCFAPVLEELYKDAPKEERVNAMKRHLEYFNTHPLAIPFILGITAALEESTDEDQKDTVVGIKTSLMGPFAGLGDSLLNLTWFPIAGSIGASMCVDNGSIVGPLVMFLLINLLYWPLKYFGLHKGYEMGMELVEKAGVQVFDRLGNLANVLGVMVTGGLVATTVKLKLAVQFAFGEGDPLVLQDQLDKVLPFLLPVVLTFICYPLPKKGPGQELRSDHHRPDRVLPRVRRHRLLFPGVQDLRLIASPPKADRSRPAPHPGRGPFRPPGIDARHGADAERVRRRWRAALQMKGSQ